MMSRVLLHSLILVFSCFFFVVERAAHGILAVRELLLILERDLAIVTFRWRLESSPQVISEHRPPGVRSVRLSTLRPRMHHSSNSCSSRGRSLHVHLVILVVGCPRISVLQLFQIAILALLLA
jgi:hypothetical protein